MTFKLEIETDNAAFDGEAKLTEIARLLRLVAVCVQNDRKTYGTLRDVNGNRVGVWMSF